MAGIASKGLGSHNYTLEISDILIGVSGYDPYKPGRNKRHGDGWGIIGFNLNPQKLLYYKSDQPLYQEPNLLKKVIEGFIIGDHAMIIHARAAGPSLPISAKTSHPFSIELDDGRSLFLAHNGSIDKSEIAAELNLKNLTAIYPDSYFILRLIARRGGSEVFENVIRSIIERNLVKTALNLLLMEIGPKMEEVKILGFSYYVKEADEKYYSMFILEKEGAKAIVSSSIANKASELGWYKIKLEIGKTFQLTL